MNYSSVREFAANLRNAIPSTPLQFIVNKEKGTVVVVKEKNLVVFCDEIVRQLVKERGYTGTPDEVDVQKTLLYDYIWHIAFNAICDRYSTSLRGTNGCVCDMKIIFTGKAKLSEGDTWNEQTGRDLSLWKCDNLIHQAKAKVFSDIEASVKGLANIASALNDKHIKWMSLI